MKLVMLNVKITEEQKKKLLQEAYKQSLEKKKTVSLALLVRNILENYYKGK